MLKKFMLALRNSAQSSMVIEAEHEVCRPRVLLSAATAVTFRRP
jgi:hypothetical protein